MMTLFQARMKSRKRPIGKRNESALNKKARAKKRSLNCWINSKKRKKQEEKENVKSASNDKQKRNG